MSRILCVISLIAVAAPGCDFPGRPNAGDVPVPAEKVLNFDVLYATNCSGCHGAKGNLGPAPPLNDPLFAAIIPNETLLGVIRGGRKGTPMPAFARTQGGTLTDAQIEVLTAGIKQHWSTPTTLPASVPPYAGGTETAAAHAEVAAGRATTIFAKACAGCHGKNGEGDSAGSIADPAFLALISDQELRRLIITGRPDLRMPNYAGSDGRPGDFKPLSSVDIDELVAELRRLSKAEMKVTQNDAAAGATRTARPSAASGARNASSN